MADDCATDLNTADWDIDGSTLTRLDDVIDSKTCNAREDGEKVLITTRNGRVVPFDPTQLPTVFLPHARSNVTNDQNGGDDKARSATFHSCSAPTLKSAPKPDVKLEVRQKDQATGEQLSLVHVPLVHTRETWFVGSPADVPSSSSDSNVFTVAKLGDLQIRVNKQLHLEAVGAPDVSFQVDGGPRRHKIDLGANDMDTGRVIRVDGHETARRIRFVVEREERHSQDGHVLSGQSEGRHIRSSGTGGREALRTAFESGGAGVVAEGGWDRWLVAHREGDVVSDLGVAQPVELKVFVRRAERTGEPPSEPTEAKTLATLKDSTKNNHIVQLIDLIRDDEFEFVVLPIYKGGSLADLFSDMKKNGTELSAGQLPIVAGQLLCALSALESQSVAHGLLTPDSVVFEQPFVPGDDTTTPIVRLVNFSSARPSGGHIATVSSHEQLTWIAPEQRSANSTASPANDAFSVALLIAACALNGHHPFEDVSSGVVGTTPSAEFIAWQLQEEPKCNPIEHIVQLLLSPVNRRPSACDIVRLHPLFWDAEETRKFFVEPVFKEDVQGKLGYANEGHTETVNKLRGHSRFHDPSGRNTHSTLVERLLFSSALTPTSTPEAHPPNGDTDLMSLRSRVQYPDRTAFAPEVHYQCWCNFVWLVKYNGVKAGKRVRSERLDSDNMSFLWCGIRNMAEHAPGLINSGTPSVVAPTAPFPLPYPAVWGEMLQYLSHGSPAQANTNGHTVQSPYAGTNSELRPDPLHLIAFLLDGVERCGLTHMRTRAFRFVLACHDPHGQLKLPFKEERLKGYYASMLKI